MAHPALAHVDHRPWPLPAGPWVMRMGWEDLLFAHRPVAAETLRGAIPAALEIDTFDGRAWIGVVPFRMTGVRLRGLPGFPGTTEFPELNVRTYVRHGSRPGVWFFSLDAASRLAVRGARRWFHLPYFDSEMSCAAGGASIAYRSRRTHRGAPAATFAARYAPSGPVFRSAPGSLEHWLTERYCLYAADRRGRILRGEIHHLPWPLQRATAEFDEDTMAAASGIALPAMPHRGIFARREDPFGCGPEARTAEAPHLLFARSLDVVAWAPVVAET